MAAKKPVNSRKNSPAKTSTAGKSRAKTVKPWGIIFWVVFFIVVFFLFLKNKDVISRTIRETRITEQMNPVADESVLPEITAAEPGIEPTETAGTPETDHVPGNSAAETENAAGEKPGSIAPGNANPKPETGTNEPAPAAQAVPARTAAPVMRDRTLYFIYVDQGGIILRNKVNRSLPVSDSPLTDAIKALLEGPIPDERQRGLISLIPEGTRIISADVRGNTAYINFSEDFQYNIYGVEGYAGALRQIVWTATEFSNIRDLQILIEGRRLDYLGEGIWIGSPLTREML